MKNYMSSAAIKVLFAVLVLAVAYLAKVFYRGADSSSLEWLLAPTVFLIERFSDIDFDNEPGLGWVSGDFGVTIAPSCSGMNYLIILFCMSSLAALLKLKSMRSLSCWLVVSAMMSYCFTLIVNSLRILVAVALYDADIYSAALTAESVHRFAGISIYYFFMVFYYLVVSFILNLTAGEKQCPATQPFSFRRSVGLLWPLGCYLFFTVVVPYLRGAAPGQHFSEHVHVVVGASVGLTMLLGLGSAVYVASVRRLWSFHAGKQHNKA